MTRKELFAAIIAGEEITNEMKATAQSLLDGLEKSEIQRRAENPTVLDRFPELVSLIPEIIGASHMTPKSIRAALAERGYDLNPSALAAANKSLVAQGVLTRPDQYYYAVAVE